MAFLYLEKLLWQTRLILENIPFLYTIQWVYLIIIWGLIYAINDPIVVGICIATWFILTRKPKWPILAIMGVNSILFGAIVGLFGIYNLLKHIQMYNYLALFEVDHVYRHPFVIRCDGHAFSKRLKSIYSKIRNKNSAQVFDKTIYDAMITAMQKTCIEFSNYVQFAETHSDEVSFRLYHIDGVRLVKMTTMITACFSNHFNKCLNIELQDDLYFDGRFILLPPWRIPNYFNSRVKDARRNAVSTWGHAKVGAKQILNKNSGQVCEMCPGFDNVLYWQPVFASFIKTPFTKTISIKNENKEVSGARRECIIGQMYSFDNDGNITVTY